MPATPEPALLPGERAARSPSLATRLRSLPGAARDLAPAREDIAHPVLYYRGARLHRELLLGGYTMLSSRRGRSLYRLAAEVVDRRVRGALVDCGVYNGGSTVLLGAGAPGREVWAFDSFEGLPEPTAADGAAAEGWTGHCHGSEHKLREAFERYADPSRLRVAKGWFEDTFPTAVREIPEVALLHCDSDWYESVLLTLRTFHSRVASGGYVVIDDYGHWAGAKRAVDEFGESSVEGVPLVHGPDGQVHWRVP